MAKPPLLDFQSVRKPHRPRKQKRTKTPIFSSRESCCCSVGNCFWGREDKLRPNWELSGRKTLKKQTRQIPPQKIHDLTKLLEFEADWGGGEKEAPTSKGS